MNLIQPIKILTILLLITVILTFDQLIETNDVVEETKVAQIVDPKQLKCLAKNIFYEAGGEPLSGQAAVARVVMNRIAHGFGKNPCAVVYQTTQVDKLVDDEVQKVKLCQFSWVCEGKGDPNIHSTRYKQAEQVAYDVLAYDAYTDVIPKSALFFHNLSVDPLWPYKQVAKIGNHIFYSKAKKPTQKTTVKSENNI